jgi:leucyl aminopeptidase
MHIDPTVTDCLSLDVENAIPIHLHDATSLKNFAEDAPSHVAAWLASHSEFSAAKDSCLTLPDAHGKLGGVIAGVARDALDIWSLAALPSQLPAGKYTIADQLSEDTLQAIALGWELAQYQFTLNKKHKTTEEKRILALPGGMSIEPVLAQAHAITLTRDLINRPTNDLGPKELAEAAEAIADTYGASFQQIIGEALLEKNYPAIHAVGRASTMEPRLIELHHGKAGDPLVTLVGKGVCFDSGGLDLKTYNSMKLMKKDMGGAALVLGLAKLIMDMQLPIRLRVLVPAVENAVSGNAFRPQDIIDTRAGLGVEIGSTDAEGRLILCDALTAAMEDSPDLVIDAATLTGAARVALGPELPAIFSNRNDIAQTLQHTAMRVDDPLWQLPLWEGYDRYLDSDITDITNTPNYRFAGAITAALYLQRFVEPNTPWIHIDTYAWNANSRPGRPVGGEALCLRALWAFLSERYAK